MKKSFLGISLFTYHYIVSPDVTGTKLEGYIHFRDTTIKFNVFYWCNTETFWFYGNKSATDKLEKILDAESISYESKKDGAVFITTFKSADFTKAYSNL